jgi:isoaspartyl peptidase/L-asparaginase-like protein (Ntn-hydrolase superfamily)
MRSCLSFLVVEFIKQGLSPQQACSKAIQRLMQLPHAHKSDRDSMQKNMYPKLTVGIVAMDKYGNVSAMVSLTKSSSLNLLSH